MPSSDAVAGHYSVERSLLRDRGIIDQVPGIQFGVGTLLERLRTLRRVYRHLDRPRIESSTASKLELVQTS